MAGFGIGFGGPCSRPATARPGPQATAHPGQRHPRSLSSTCSTCPAEVAGAVGYVKIAEGCDRKCGFCAIPSFRGKQRSQRRGRILAEVDELAAEEIILVAQDLASYGKDRPADLGAGAIVPLVGQSASGCHEFACCTCTRATSATS